MPLARSLVLLGLLVGGLALVGHGFTTYQEQRSDVQHAVEVEGTVQSTGVETFGWKFMRVDGVGVAQASDETRYRVVVRYTYTYEGQEYTSESVYPGAERRHALERTARSVADRYSDGETVTVYVNQKDPSRSYLVERTTHFRPGMFMGLGGLFALTGGYGLAAGLLGAGGDESEE
jgi:hypothetical protein